MQKLKIIFTGKFPFYRKREHIFIVYNISDIQTLPQKKDHKSYIIIIKDNDPLIKEKNNEADANIIILTEWIYKIGTEYYKNFSSHDKFQNNIQNLLYCDVCVIDIETAIKYSDYFFGTTLPGNVYTNIENKIMNQTIEQTIERTYVPLNMHLVDIIKEICSVTATILSQKGYRVNYEIDNDSFVIGPNKAGIEKMSFNTKGMQGPEESLSHFAWEVTLLPKFFKTYEYLIKRADNTNPFTETFTNYSHNTKATYQNNRIINSNNTESYYKQHLSTKLTFWNNLFKTNNNYKLELNISK